MTKKHLFLLEICSWSKVKAEELKNEFNSLRNYVLNLDSEKSLTLVLYREFKQLKKKEEHDYVSKDTLIKFMQTLSGKNLLFRELLQRFHLLWNEYRKVASINMSWLEAHFMFYKLFLKGKFDVYLLQPFKKKSIF